MRIFFYSFNVFYYKQRRTKGSRGKFFDYLQLHIKEPEKYLLFQILLPLLMGVPTKDFFVVFF